MNPGDVVRLTRIAHDGTWYRAVDSRFFRRAVDAAHTMITPSRFSGASPGSPSFEILYLAENHLVAMFEAKALFGSPLKPSGVISHPAVSLAVVPVEVRLSAIVDFSDPEQAALVGTNAQELTGDWLGYRDRDARTSVTGPVGNAPTQELGEHLFRLCPDVQGLISVSARLPYHRILAIFSERLKIGIDYIRYTITDEGGLQRRIQLPS